MSRCRKMVHRDVRLYSGALLILLGLAVPPAGAASIYTLTTNTSSLSGTTGFLDFQFNPAGTAQAATVTVSSFTSNGTVLTPLSFPTLGSVSGQLPGALTLNNTSSLNEVTQDFKFGTTVSFRVTFSGIAVTNPNNGSFGSSFSFSMFDGNGIPLLTNNLSGAAIQINLNPNGTTSALNFSTGTSPAVGISTLAVPEPPSLALGLLGGILAGGAQWTRRWRERAHPGVGREYDGVSRK